MRLIDADILLKSFAESNHIKETASGLDVMEMLAIKEIIDNAPTVDALPLEYHDRVLDMTVAELQACQANLPQKGEWQETDTPESTLCKCSICNFDLGAYTFNFCPNCGAEMRKGGAE